MARNTECLDTCTSSLGACTDTLVSGGLEVGGRYKLPPGERVEGQEGAEGVVHTDLGGDDWVVRGEIQTSGLPIYVDYVLTEFEPC